MEENAFTNQLFIVRRMGESHDAGYAACCSWRGDGWH